MQVETFLEKLDSLAAHQPINPIKAVKVSAQVRKLFNENEFSDEFCEQVLGDVYAGALVESVPKMLAKGLAPTSDKKVVRNLLILVAVLLVVVVAEFIYFS